MQLAVLGLAGAATVLSVVAVTSPPAGPTPAEQGSQPTLDRLMVSGQAMRGVTLQPAPPDEAVAQELAKLTVQRVNTEIVLGLEREALRLASRAYTERQDQPLSGIAMRAEFTDVPLEQVLEGVVAAADRPSIIRWANIESDGRERATPVTITLNAEVPIDTLLRLVNQAVDLEGISAIEYRVADGIFELATRGYFDKRERTLVVYDLSAITAGGIQSEQVVTLITEIVEMENWVDNGGEIARAHLLADRLFITAPPRMHERIRWVLMQLDGDGADPISAAENALLGAQGGATSQTPAPVDAWGTPIHTYDQAR